MNNPFRKVKEGVRSVLRRHSILVTRYPLQDCLKHLCPKTILDVGANIGQYGLELRSLGFRGMIHSFEPFLPAFSSLQKVATQSRPHDAWQCYNYGLGDKESEEVMHVSRMSPFNSLREPLPQSVKLHAGIVSTDTVPIKVKTLDAIWPQLDCADKPVLLKIDTQGYELPILQGGKTILPMISAIQLEVSFTPLYRGQPCIEELVPFMRGQGFVVYGLWPTGIRDEQARLFEADCIFVRAKS